MTNSEELHKEEVVDAAEEAEIPAAEAAEEAVPDEAPAAGVPAEEAPTEDSEAEKVAAELASVKDQLLRTMAEYDNFRKRSAREKDALRADIITTVTSQFLPVMDNLVRALEADCADENYKNGVQMIYDSFMTTLKNLGVEEIESDGADFDPAMHQAVQRVDDSGLESGKVAKTFAKGYKINDKVIRFAMVAVAN
ncbi:MAG: nucleotide exchange factor GrpE [Oscillospiraceae bacterium]